MEFMQKDCERRAHERINTLAQTVEQHLEDHKKFEDKMDKLVDNTSEIVELVKGAKGLRNFLIWAAPIAAAIIAVTAWLKKGV